MRKFLVLSLILFISGCASAQPTIWDHPTKTNQEFYEDDAFCMSQSGQAAIGLEGMVAVDVRKQTRDSCMMGKGWVMQ